MDRSPLSRNSFAALSIAATALAGTTAVPAQQAAAPVVECVIEPHLVVELSSAVDGVVARVHADRADEVKAGQLLAELESDVEQRALALASARAEMVSEVRLQEVALGYESRRQNRVSTLFQTSALSLQEKEEADAQSQLSSWRLRKARDDQQLAKLEAERAAAALQRRSIRSPLDGVVVERFVGPGESVEDQPLYRVAQLDPLNVEVIVPVSMFGEVEEGMRAEVVPEDPVGGTYAARVEIVDRVLDAASGTFGVRLSLPNPDYQIPAGLRCQVQFLSGVAAGDAAAGDQRQGARATDGSRSGGG